MKHLLRSTTIQGALVTVCTLLLSLLGIKLDADETRGIVDGLREAWPQMLAIGTALAAAWQRVKTWDFDKSLFRSRTFYLGIVSALLSGLSAAGVPTEGVQGIAEQIVSLLASLGPIFGSIMIVVGRVRAKTPIRIERAQP